MINSKFAVTESFFYSVLDAIGHDILIVSNEGEIVFMNVQAKTNLFLDFTPKNNEKFKKVIEKFISKCKIEDSVELKELVNNTFDSINFITSSLTVKLFKNGNKTYEIHTSPIYDSQKGHLGRMWQFRDVSEREHINQMKTEFLSIASHQLRTPLTSIRGYTDMIINGDFGTPNDELREPLDAIATSSAEMSELIDNLLNISRLERGLTGINEDSFNLTEVITEIIAELDQKATKRSIRLEIHLYSKKISVKSDKLRIKESIKNLVDNAIKYSPENTKVLITVTETDKDTIAIEVLDEGFGIPSDQQDKIFEKFFRAANVLTENFDGTGLGLYYVKKSIEELGGSISFSSQEKHGTTFTILLPKKLEKHS